MSFLAPIYLLLAGAIAVPLLIHLMRRRVGARVEFPAARYLERAEKEHSRTLKIRNLLLMFLRVLALIAIAAAAARPIARWLGAGHAPTAIAIVIDNSLSSSAVVNGRPLLDQFKGMARDVLSNATPADRIWLVGIDGRDSDHAIFETAATLDADAGAIAVPLNRVARNADDLRTSGNVAPINAVGTRRTANTMAKRAAASSDGEDGSDGYIRTYVSWSAARTAGLATAVAPIRSSAAPNHTRGRRTLSASHPALALPAARPAMKLAETVAAA